MKVYRKSAMTMTSLNRAIDEFLEWTPKVGHYCEGKVGGAHGFIGVVRGGRALVVIPYLPDHEIPAGARVAGQLISEAGGLVIYCNDVRDLMGIFGKLDV